jgi:hypothetical protein
MLVVVSFAKMVCSKTLYYYNALFVLHSFGFLITKKHKNNNSKKLTSFPIPLSFLFLFFSPSFFFLLRSRSPGTLEFPLSYLSYFLLYLDSLIISLLSCFYFYPFYTALHSSTFLLLLIFPLLN